MTKLKKRFVIHQIAYPPMCLLFMLQRFLCKRRQCTQHLRVYNSHKLCFKMKMTKVYSKHLLMKSSRNNFFSTCILPDYVSHESSKEFWKNSHFENMRADFLMRCQNLLRQTSPEMMHFQA